MNPLSETREARPECWCPHGPLPECSRVSLAEHVFWSALFSAPARLTGLDNPGDASRPRFPPPWTEVQYEAVEIQRRRPGKPEARDVTEEAR